MGTCIQHTGPTTLACHPKLEAYTYLTGYILLITPKYIYALTIQHATYYIWDLDANTLHPSPSLPQASTLNIHSILEQNIRNEAMRPTMNGQL